MKIDTNLAVELIDITDNVIEEVKQKLITQWYMCDKYASHDHCYYSLTRMNRGCFPICSTCLTSWCLREQVIITIA
jgi:hypothetical protein